MINRLKGPSGTYPLGTDHIGRDLFSRLLYGARVSLGVGFAATTLSVVVSLLIGGVAGFVGGKLDLAVQRLVDAKLIRWEPRNRWPARTGDRAHWAWQARRQALYTWAADHCVRRTRLPCVGND